jgi:hypothetical protein
MASTEIHPAASGTIPSLEFGDRLTRDEFDNRNTVVRNSI